KVIDRFPAGEANARDYEVAPAPAHAPNVLELSIDRVLNQKLAGISDDNRDLGLLMRFLSFGPV
ncbi:MAG: hypothetical protein JWO97_1703, partial [Acidobacteria bacterium]|nr:hypothetical protein [Acidobacteriota bacterium]